MARAKAPTRRSFGKVRKLPSDRFQASFIGPDGIRYVAPRTYDAKQDAEGWLAGESRLIQLGEWTPPPTRDERKSSRLVPFRQYAETWLSERDLTPKTRSLYRTLLDSRILPSLGDLTMAEVTPAMVRTWWAGLGKATPTRSAHAYQLLKTIMNTAVADKVLVENPCQIKTAGRPPKAREVELLTLDELTTVTADVMEHYRAAVPVLAWCGLRFGELIELRRKDVVVSGGKTVLRIRRAATRVDGEIVVGKPKSDAGIRDIHVPPHVAAMLGLSISPATRVRVSDHHSCRCRLVCGLELRPGVVADVLHQVPSLPLKLRTLPPANVRLIWMRLQVPAICPHSHNERQECGNNNCDNHSDGLQRMCAGFLNHKASPNNAPGNHAEHCVPGAQINADGLKGGGCPFAFQTQHICHTACRHP